MTHNPEPANTPTGRPYQSRLLNFCNRQQILWRDRVAQTSRQLQMTLVWSAQIVLYPVYLLTQLARGFALRLEAATAPSVPSALSTTTVSDRPVQNTLRVLVELDETIEVTTVPPFPELPAATIQGIASDRASRQLVLVTSTNQIRADLTPQQQQQLHTKICWELADAAHQKYLLKVQANRYRVPLQLTQAPEVWLPMRRFWQLMRWLQTSPIAIASNVFGEAEYELPSATLALPTMSLIPDLTSLGASDSAWLHQLDQTLVKLETQQAQFNQTLAKWWQHQGQPRTHQFAQIQRTLGSRLQILLGTGAIVETVSQETLPPESSVWPTWEDLMDHSRDQVIASVPQEPSLTEAEMVLDLPFATSHTPVFMSELPEQFPQPPAPSEITPAAPKNAQELHHSAEPASPEYQPDWIEVKSETMGYEMHLLERILRVFDRAMFLLEEAVLVLWRWLRKRLPGS
jgi:hypothetical protein